MTAEQDNQKPKRVLLTGATGFVGAHVLKKLIASGHVPVCLVRDPAKFERIRESYAGSEIASVQGELSSMSALNRAAEQSDHAIHLVGIIMERGKNTFSRVHYEGTRNVINACRHAGISRYVHMSALGAREDAASRYHQTKYTAETCVRKSGLSWTIFRPSIIHGPDGEFMELMRTFVCSAVMPPVIPYFGKGQHRLQPVDVRDVSECFVKALTASHTIHRTYELGGPRSYSWKELYALCKKHIPGARQWKPMIGQPVLLAKAIARTVMKVPVPFQRLDKLRFDVGQVQMSQEDSVCNIAPAEEAFDMTFRDFETELSQYADRIR